MFFLKYRYTLTLFRGCAFKKKLRQNYQKKKTLQQFSYGNLCPSKPNFYRNSHTCYLLNVVIRALHGHKQLSYISKLCIFNIFR